MKEEVINDHKKDKLYGDEEVKKIKDHEGKKGRKQVNYELEDEAFNKLGDA